MQLPVTQVQFQYLLELTAMTGMIRPTVSVSVGAYIQDLTVVEKRAEDGA